MKNFAENVRKLIISINSMISLNRCSFSIEDLTHLEECISKLRELEADVTKTPEEKLEVFVGVVIALDKFFCTDKCIQMTFNIHN